MHLLSDYNIIHARKLYIFVIFQGGGGVRTPCPVPPLDPPIGMHLKEGTCLKCSFQRVVIIGRKVGLDYNSWYACLPLIRHAGRSSRSKLFANFDSRS